MPRPPFSLLKSPLRPRGIFLALLCLANAGAHADEPMKYIYDAPESALDQRYLYHWKILATALEKTKANYGPYVMEPAVFMTEKRQAFELRNATGNLALDLGVKGFVLKENAVQDILTSLATVAAGGHYLSPTISGYLVRRRNRVEELATRTPGLDDLTKAERRVLKLIAENKTSREIAAELFISPRTVEAHRANISTKLQLRGSHSLLRFALENRAAI